MKVFTRKTRREWVFIYL